MSVTFTEAQRARVLELLVKEKTASILSNPTHTHAWVKHVVKYGMPGFYSGPGASGHSYYRDEELWRFATDQGLTAQVEAIMGDKK